MHLAIQSTTRTTRFFCPSPCHYFLDTSWVEYWGARRKRSNSCIFCSGKRIEIMVLGVKFQYSKCLELLPEHLNIELSGFLPSPSQTWPNLSKKQWQTVSNQNQVALVATTKQPLEWLFTLQSNKAILELHVMTEKKD